MKPTLTLGHGNGHNKRDLTRLVRDAKADSFSCNESQKLTDLLRDLGRITVADGPPHDRVRSTCIVTDRELDQLGEVSLRIADAMPHVSEKLHPDRALAGSFYRHPIADAIGARGVAHFSAHPPPGIMRHDSHRHPIALAYRDALDVVREQMRAARAAGYLLALSGDLQAGARYADAWGPRALLAKPLDLRCWVTRIDWLMFDAELQLAGPPREVELFDHTGYVAKLRQA
jgi:hypothetical protein